MQARELRAAHAAELEALGARVAEVVARKDAAAAALRSQLDATLAQLHGVADELLLQQEQ